LYRNTRNKTQAPLFERVSPNWRSVERVVSNNAFCYLGAMQSPSPDPFDALAHELTGALGDRALRI
jgi:hypothetical protein